MAIRRRIVLSDAEVNIPEPPKPALEPIEITGNDFGRNVFVARDGSKYTLLHLHADPSILRGMLETGIMTVNEARQILGYEPVFTPPERFPVEQHFRNLNRLLNLEEQRIASVAPQQRHPVVIEPRIAELAADISRRAGQSVANILNGDGFPEDDVIVKAAETKPELGHFKGIADFVRSLSKP